MKITTDRLGVARAVAERHVGECARELLERNESCVLRDGRVREIARLCEYAGIESLRVAESLVTDAALRVVAAIPEPPDDSPATLPAPTGPGLWWTKRVGSPWFPCEVYRDGEYLIVYLIGSDVDESVGDFDAWLPLVAPTAKGGV